MLQILMENVSANEQENKKKTVTSQYSVQALNASKPTGPVTRSRSLEPTASNASKAGYVPGKMMHNPPPGAVTPAVRSGSSMSQTTTKRQKLADGRAKPMRSSSPAKGRTPSGPASGLPRSTVHAPPVSHVTTRSRHATGYASLGWGRAPSTAQRTKSRAVTTTGVSSHRHASATKLYGASSMVARTSSLDKGGRIKRESFRPRPSIDGVRGGGAAFRGMPPTEEE
jgi:protein regulator of cytokinesis 1